jgi:hypothetical protein
MMLPVTVSEQPCYQPTRLGVVPPAADLPSYFRLFFFVIKDSFFFKLAA